MASSHVFTDSDADAEGSDVEREDTLVENGQSNTHSPFSTIPTTFKFPQALAAIPNLQPSNSTFPFLPSEASTTASSFLSPGGINGQKFAQDDDAEQDEQRIQSYMKEILNHSKALPHIQATMDSILLPEANLASLSSILQQAAKDNGRIPRENGLDKAVATKLRSLVAGGSFSRMTNDRAETNPPLEEPSRKRKHDAIEDIDLVRSRRAPSTPFPPQTPSSGHQSPSIPGGLHIVHEGIRRVLVAFQHNTIDKHLIGSVQLQLHHVFLFAITSGRADSPLSPQKKKTLNEISKLIQLLGVLSGVQISVGDPSTSLNVTLDEEADTLQRYNGNGDATSPFDESLRALVFPCSYPSCLKTFHKLASLRVHQRSHLDSRPFKCQSCPASFTRGHDLTRHMRGHGSLVYKCAICAKAFSRRDAFMRHRKNGRNLRGRNKERVGRLYDCTNAEYELVEIPPEQRKTSGYWDATRGWDPVGAHNDDNYSEPLEADEVSAQDLESALEEMGEFHSVLRETVANILSSSASHPGSNGNSVHGHASMLSSPLASLGFDPVSPSASVWPDGFHASDRQFSSTRNPVQAAAMESLNPFSDIFPELDFRELGLDLQQLMTVDQIVEAASASALTLAEREAGLELAGSGPMNPNI
ncbi:Metallothionein expression activator [Serendipita sp. 411]|nr:Metallothionein expression activator [Serendipita sp. 400]KAG8861119.1 Metallothionein expression activator [Serendipita sp. 411]KAG9056543.1 Metallothionein expression activator [Serendipita sp. 407]